MQHVTRRGFLKVGLLGTVVLVGAGGAYRLLSPAPSPAPFVLDTKARTALAAIVPVMLQSAIEPAAVGDAVGRVEMAIKRLPLVTQQEIRDLFALLTLAPTRRIVVGLADDWPHAAQSDIAAFLQRWRRSRFTLLQIAYHALHDLITGAWYADESTWPAIGYPGPLKALA